jgi:hypothetical protein
MKKPTDSCPGERPCELPESNRRVDLGLSDDHVRRPSPVSFDMAAAWPLMVFFPLVSRSLLQLFFFFPLATLVPHTITTTAGLCACAIFPHPLPSPGGHEGTRAAGGGRQRAARPAESRRQHTISFLLRALKGEGGAGISQSNGPCLSSGIRQGLFRSQTEKMYMPDARHRRGQFVVGHAGRDSPMRMVV